MNLKKKNFPKLFGDIFGKKNFSQQRLECQNCRENQHQFFLPILTLRNPLGKNFFAGKIAQKFGKNFFSKIHKQFPYDFAIPISAPPRSGSAPLSNSLYRPCTGRGLYNRPASLYRPGPVQSTGLFVQIDRRRCTTRNPDFGRSRIPAAIGQKLELQNHKGIAYEFEKKNFPQTFWRYFRKKIFPSNVWNAKIIGKTSISFSCQF